jgi:hypothetical protein
MDNIVRAAIALLEARQNQMVTVDEWLNLARAVTEATGHPLWQLVTDDDLREDARSREQLDVDD